jgi:hypothetical protein
MQRLNISEYEKVQPHPRESAAHRRVIYMCAMGSALFQSALVMFHEPLLPHSTVIGARVENDFVDDTHDRISDLQGSLIGRCVTIAHPTIPGETISFRIERNADMKELTVTVNDTTFYCPDGITLLGDVRPSEVIDDLTIKENTLIIFSKEYGTATIPLDTIRNALLTLHAKSTQEGPQIPLVIDAEATVTPEESNTIFAGMWHTRAMMFGNKLALSLNVAEAPRQMLAQKTPPKPELALAPLKR